jgi:hypothetical protein
VDVRVAVRAGVAVRDGVAVGEEVGVALGVAVGVRVGVGVLVFVAVRVAVKVLVEVSVGSVVAVRVAVDDGGAVRVAVRDAVAVGDGVAVMLPRCTMTTGRTTRGTTVPLADSSTGASAQAPELSTTTRPSSAAMTRPRFAMDDTSPLSSPFYRQARLAAMGKKDCITQAAPTGQEAH